MPGGTPSPPKSAGDVDEIHLVFPQTVYNNLQTVLFPQDSSHPFHGKYERGAFCVVCRSTGNKRLSYLVRKVIHPRSENDLDVAQKQNDVIDREYNRDSGSFLSGWLPSKKKQITSHSLQFSQSYHHQSIDQARSLEGGLLRVHTHPGAGRVGPSTIDKRSAKRVFSQDVDRLPPGAPLVAAISNEDESWSARVYEFGANDVFITPITALRIVGPEFEKLETPDSPDGPGGAYGQVDKSEQDSTIQAWGIEGQRVLSGLRVGLVGCGGVGSILAEHLARLGVGELVLVDFDRLERVNRNRAQGASEIDVRQHRLKTHVAERVAEKAATSPEFDTTVIDGSPVESDPQYTAVPGLLDCDIIVEAVDSARPRYILDHIASAHCIPVVSGGSRLHVDSNGMLAEEAKIEINATGPEWPCFECQRVWLSEDVEYERDHPRYRGERGYVEGGVDPEDEPRSPSVIGINAIVAGLIQRRFQAIVQGIALQIVPPTRINPLNLDVDPMSIISCEEDCNRPPIAAGDQYHLPCGTDWSMRYERDDIPMPEVKTDGGDLL